MSDDIQTRLRDDARTMARINHFVESEEKTLPWEAADEIDRLTGEVSRLDTLSRAQAVMIKTMSEDNNAYRHFECATIINTMKSKADALAAAVETERDILAARDDIISQHVAVALRTALTAYRRKDDG
jgi:hypothetical protein